MSNPVVHWEIQSNQTGELRDYYSKLFGWEVHVTPDFDYSLVHTHEEGERGIDGGIGATQGGPSRVTFYVEVNDMEGYLKKAEELGGKTVMPIMTIPGQATFALFSDPEGNVVGIVSLEALAAQE